MIGGDFIFVHVPKTGGTSMVRFMRPNRGGMYDYADHSAVEFKHDSHWNLEEYKAVLGTEAYSKRFRFTIVRNPWDRMVSFHAGTQRKVMKLDTPVDSDLFNKYTVMALGSEENWDAVLRARLHVGCKRCAPGNHRRSIEPYYFWFHIDEMHFIARTENLNTDMYTLLDKLEKFRDRRLKRPETLHLGGGSNRNVDYRLYYSDETRRLVGEHFAADIETFGYRY
jgi:hypothetical protein